MRKLPWILICGPFSTLLVVTESCSLRVYQVIDLLNPGSARKPLAVRWSKKSRGFFVENLFTVDCETLDDLLAVLEEGMRNRSVGSHNMNEYSSRSHTILTVHITSEQQVRKVLGKGLKSVAQVGLLVNVTIFKHNTKVSSKMPSVEIKHGCGTHQIWQTLQFNLLPPKMKNSRWFHSHRAWTNWISLTFNSRETFFFYDSQQFWR